MTSFTRRQTLLAAAAAPLALGLAGPARAATHQVAIRGFAFVPDLLNVAVGDTVVFTNEDSAPHTATAGDRSFDTGRLNGGQSAEVTITAAGTHDYVCAFHGGMTGKITAS